MTDQEKSELRERAVFCQSHKYELAHIGRYIKDLGDGAPPDGVAEGTVDHLLYLLDQPVVPDAVVTSPEPVAEKVEAAHEAADAAPSTTASPQAEAPHAAEVDAAFEEPAAQVETPAPADAPAEPEETETVEETDPNSGEVKQVKKAKKGKKLALTPSP